MIEPAPLQQVSRTFVRSGNRKLSYFSGCDYFRLASHPKMVAALESGAKKYGLSVSASRLTTGNHMLYLELEAALKRFFAAEDALLTSGGYLTNLIAAQGLAGNFSHGLIDEKAHPSLHDASRFLDCPVVTFKHKDVGHLTTAVKRCGPGAKLLVITDGMFSHDGSAAPLKQYLKILPADALLLVDDAHGAGVLGKSGKGTLEHEGVSRRRTIQTLTLSKAFGSYGGAILSTRAFRKRILERSQAFVGHTPLPLPLANAALQAIKLLETDGSFRRRLLHNNDYLKKNLRCFGLLAANDALSMPGPIFRFLPSKNSPTKKIIRALRQANIFPPFTQYPGGPTGGAFRFVISSEHTRKQLDGLIELLSAL
jgi:7-keto-8-aminopelargonate synthetase-like enzyme